MRILKQMLRIIYNFSYDLDSKRKMCHREANKLLKVIL